MRISDWSSDVCSSDLGLQRKPEALPANDAAAEADSRRLDRILLDSRARQEDSATPRCVQRDSALSSGPDRAGARRACGNPRRQAQIGRAAWRESVCQSGYIPVVAVSLQQKTPT